MAATPKVIDEGGRHTLVLPITRVTKALGGAPRAMASTVGSTARHGVYCWIEEAKLRRRLARERVAEAPETIGRADERGP